MGFELFRSRTILGHLAKGVLGFTFLVIALKYGPELGWWAAIPFLAALASFRGCPVCWTVGLVETVIHRKSAHGCVDGSCGTSFSPPDPGPHVRADRQPRA